MKQVLIDANLLILLVAGSVDSRIITKHKRLDAYRVTDYDVLISTIERFDKVLVIPNVLSEASNLLSQTGERTARALRLGLREQIAGSLESYIPSQAAAERPEYQRLGLTDAALLQCLIFDSARTLLTADLELYLAAATSGRDAINFNHLREFPEL